MTLLESVGVVANLLMAAACLLNGILLFTLRRLLQWPAIRLLMVIFSLLLVTAGLSHVAHALTHWAVPALEWVYVVLLGASACLLLVGGGLLYVLVQDRPGTLLDLLTDLSTLTHPDDDAK